MWRSRPGASRGLPKSGILRHILFRYCSAVAARPSFGRKRTPRSPATPPSRVICASSRHRRRHSGGSWRPVRGRARLGSLKGQRPTGEAAVGREHPLPQLSAEIDNVSSQLSFVSPARRLPSSTSSGTLLIIALNCRSTFAIAPFLSRLSRSSRS